MRSSAPEHPRTRMLELGDTMVHAPQSSLPGEGLHHLPNETTFPLTFWQISQKYCATMRLRVVVEHVLSLECERSSFVFHICGTKEKTNLVKPINKRIGCSISSHLHSTV
jgi:formate-dependent phosphoribosylglycinamide formyltransferase (GAR transformylase)